jgi:MarR family transcriptional regulator, 2-MHQ and catechol-resistance regulon repressor
VFGSGVSGVEPYCLADFKGAFDRAHLGLFKVYFMSQSSPLTIRPFGVLRELINSYDAFYQGVLGDVEQFGLSPEQFDVVATLGNTAGLSLVQLGEKTLLNHPIHQVLDSLEADMLISRELPADKPMMIIRLTPAGEKIFAVVFPIHMAYIQRCFGQLNQSELDMLQVFLKRLKKSFAKND